jgi:hypothetical protein
VIPVSPKKQRVNDYYLEPDSQLGDDDDSYYDDEYDSEMDELQEMIFERARLRGQELSVEIINGLGRDLVDDLALEHLTRLCRQNLRAHVDNWAEVHVIPLRMLSSLEDLTRGRVMRIPTEMRNLII